MDRVTPITATRAAATVANGCSNEHDINGSGIWNLREKRRQLVCEHDSRDRQLTSSLTAPHYSSSGNDSMCIAVTAWHSGWITKTARFLETSDCLRARDQSGRS